MRRPPRSRRPRLAVERLEATQLLALTFLVTTTADSGPGSLRQAILDLNAAPTTSFPSDTIDFAIPGTGTHTIAPLTPLPVITNPVYLDGDSQPGYVRASPADEDSGFPAPPMIVLDGVNAVAAGGGPVDGLDSQADDTVSVTALEIIRFSGTAINIDGSRTGDGSNVTDSYIGTDGVDGQDLGNGGYGVRFVNPSYYNWVVKSVIEYNSLRGVDYPTSPPATFGASSYVTLDNVYQAHNNTQSTTLRIAPAGDETSTVEPGSTQTLVYTVTNAGAIAATGVSVPLYLSQSAGFVTVASTTTTAGTIEEGDGSASGPFATAALGTLAPGASATITVVVQVDPDSTAMGEASITATAAASTLLDEDPIDLSRTDTLVSGNGPPSYEPVTIDGPSPPLTIDPTPGDLATGSTTPTVTASTPPATTSAPSTPAVATPADLVVSSTAPTTASVGAASLLQFDVRNAGSGAAGDAVAAVDLTGVPAGSFYAILSQSGSGGSGMLAPLAGRPGVYLVDLGELAAGASATVAIMVMPAAGGPLHVAVAATDAGNPTVDPHPVDNLAYAGAVVAPAVATRTLTAAATILLDSGSTTSRAAADNPAHSRVATATATATTAVAASPVAPRRRVTLRVAHPLPVRVAQARHATTG